MAQNVLQDVRNSYWRALGAQRLLGRVDALLARVNTAATGRAGGKRRSGAGLGTRLPACAARCRQSAHAAGEDLELALSPELAALMSIPPRAPPTRWPTRKKSRCPHFPATWRTRETLALEKRPSSGRKGHRKRVTADDIKAAKLLLWPNLSMDAGPQYDSNKYNYNSNWVDVGRALCPGMCSGLAQLPALNRAEKSQAETDDLRRMALSMAVLTQVRVGVSAMSWHFIKRLKFAEESLGVDNRLLLSFSQKTPKDQF